MGSEVMEVGRKEEVRFRSVVHLVRDPLKVIVSRARRAWPGDHATRWLTTAACLTDMTYHTTSGGDSSSNSSSRRSYRLDSWDHAIAAAARHVVLWNFFVESHASRRVRIEDLDAEKATGDAAQALCVDFLASSSPARMTASGSPCPPAVAFASAAATLSDRVNAHGSRRPGGEGVAAGTAAKARAKALWAELLTWARLKELDAETAALGRIQARRYGYAVVEDNEDDQGLIPRCHFDAGGRWTCRLVPAKNWRSER